MNRVRTILPLALGVSLATGASVAANAACQLQSPGGASQIKTVLNDAAFNQQPVHEGDEDGLGHHARALIDQVEDLAEQNHDHDHDRGHPGE